MKISEMNNVLIFTYYILGDSMALKGVVLDSGHGGSDVGASGNGIIEKDLTLKISKYMYDRLKALGIPVKMTRDSDITLDPKERVRVVRDQFGNGSDVVVVSNHINAGGAEGAEVIYALRNNSRLASKILDELEKSGQVVRKYYQRRLPSDTSKDYYYIIRDTPNNQTVIVEYGFLDNTTDAQKLKNNYEKYAEAVVKAIAEYGGYKYTPVAGSDYYVVKKGDSLWSIARTYGLTVEKLKSLNNLSSNTLNIGDVLLIKSDSTNSNDEVDGYEYYTVVKGDSLYSIARKYNLTVDELKNMNNLSSNTLSIGQKLIIGKTTYSNVYIVKKGDTLYSIARNYNTTVDEIKKANNLSSNSLSIGQELVIPTKSENQTVSTQTYTVKKGDTLYNIAKNFNTTVTDIKKLNNLNSNILSVGQKLIIPS